MWRLNLKEPSEKQEITRANARQMIEQAHDLFQKAFEQSKSVYERFPRATIDDPKVRADRMQAQSDYLLAQLNLAICKFEEGVTYEPKSSDRLKTLADAVSEFETIHVKNRTLSAGAGPAVGGKVLRGTRKLAKGAGHLQPTGAAAR